MATLIRLCESKDFTNNICQKISYPHNQKKSIVVIKREEGFYAYENVCPHFSLPLDYREGVFNTYQNKIIMCAHHSAMFEIMTGLCLDGPCKGHSLTQLPIRVIDGVVFLSL